jgi:hypothetical protein
MNPHRHCRIGVGNRHPDSVIGNSGFVDLRDQLFHHPKGRNQSAAKIMVRHISTSD